MTDVRVISFEKIDSLRKHMLLTRTQMAQLLGVSRVTYYNWKALGSVTPRNVVYVRKVLKEVLRIMVDHEWPSPNVVAMQSDDRYAELLKLIRVV
jgi:transcriptional regulator with XRE-family HTH domain